MSNTPLRNISLRSYVTVRERARGFLVDDRGGERDTLTTLLILALIIIPLVVLIILFGERIEDEAQRAWDEIMDGGL